MIITDLSHLDDLREQKAAVKGGHSYSKSYTVKDYSYSASFHPSSRFSKYLKHFDLPKYGKHVSHHGISTVAKAYAYGHGAHSHTYAVAKASAH